MGVEARWTAAEVFVVGSWNGLRGRNEPPHAAPRSSLHGADARPVAVAQQGDVAPAVTTARLTAVAAVRANARVAHLADATWHASHPGGEGEAHAAVVAREREVAGIAHAALLSNRPALFRADPVEA